MIAVLGAAGLAVGLALQGLLSNLAAGVLLVMFRPFRAGEYVDLGGVAGTVLNVQIFSTTLRTADGKVVVVPNGKIIAGNIINFSREPARRNEFIIGVAYDADIDKVKQLLTSIINLTIEFCAMGNDRSSERTRRLVGELRGARVEQKQRFAKRLLGYPRAYQA